MTTPRWPQHEEWLLDHERAMAEIRATLAVTIEIQRVQSTVLLELGQQVARLLERWNNADFADGLEP